MRLDCPCGKHCPIGCPCENYPGCRITTPAVTVTEGTTTTVTPTQQPNTGTTATFTPTQQPNTTTITSTTSILFGQHTNDVDGYAPIEDTASLIEKEETLEFKNENFYFQYISSHALVYSELENDF